MTDVKSGLAVTEHALLEANDQHDHTKALPDPSTPSLSKTSDPNDVSSPPTTVRRISIVMTEDKKPTLDALEMPEVQLSMERADGSMTTPRPEPEVVAAVASGASSDGITAPQDYFSPSVVSSPTVTAVTVAAAPPRSSTPDLAQKSMRESRRSSLVAEPAPQSTAHDDGAPLSRTSTRHTSASGFEYEPDAFSSSAGGSYEILSKFDIKKSRRAPRRSMTDSTAEAVLSDDGPRYPDQSLAALHHQVYPAPYAAPYASRNRRPSRSQASFHGLTRIDVEESRSVDRLPRTAGNTPIVSPSTMLHQLHRPSFSPSPDGHSPIPSPYLHPVQSHPPKETTRAIKDHDNTTGRKTINQYEIMDEIGRGVHGKVKLARNLETETFVAIKIVQRYSKKKRLGKPTTNPEDKVKKEIAILKKAVHPNVVSMIEVIDDPEIAKIYIVLEFCELQEVNWRVQGSSEIVLMEARRLERERRGAGEESPEDHDPRSNVMAIAERRRRNAARLSRPPLSRIQSASDFWSLEYAGSDDEHEEIPDKPFVTSAPITRITSNVTSPIVSQNFHSTFDDDIAPDQMVSSTTAIATEPEPFDPNATTTQATFAAAKQEVATKNADSASFGGVPSDHRQMLNALNDDGEPWQLHQRLEERGRQRSVAESISSHLTELVEEELDEESRYVPSMTLTETRHAFRDALTGLEYLHYQGIIHRDIKPANLLRKADGRVKISDFGVSYLGKPVRYGDESAETSESESHELEEETELAKTVGTPAFYAPELCSLDLTAQHPPVSKQLDVWALGVTLYCLLYGRVPFNAENEYALMRRIAEDDVFISRKRLKAVERGSESRASSHGPLFRMKERRLPGELLYDDVDDQLYDLLTRLFIKDPQKRITVEQIKRHPWVIRDVHNPTKWLIESDPSRWQSGKRIEISKEEVQEAVIPLKVLERAKSLARKAVGVFSFPKARRRGQSSAASSDAGSQGSDTSSRSGKRSTEKFDMNLAAALKASRDREREQLSGEHYHPLSQSVTASPDAPPKDFVRDYDSESQFSSSDQLKDLDTPSRPEMPPRNELHSSTAASIKTIRQSDIERSGRLQPEDNSMFGSTTLTALFGDAGRSFMRSVARSRERRGPEQMSQRSSSPHVRQGQDFHGQPSLALNTVAAEGHMDSPKILKSPSEHSPGTPNSNIRGVSSTPSSVDVSRSASPIVLTETPHRPALSPQSTMQRLLHRSRSFLSGFTEGSQDSISQLSSPEQEKPERPTSHMRRNDSTFLELAPLPETPSISQGVSTASSEDHLSLVSQSNSYPSMDSVISESASAASMHDSMPPYNKGTAPVHSSATINAQRSLNNSPEAHMTSGFHAQQANHYSFNSDDEDDDDSDSGDDFLVMSRPQSRVHNVRNIPQRRNSEAHRSSPLSKVERSESAKTVKRADTQSIGECDEQGS